MTNKWLNIPATLPAKIFALREGSFATDLLIAAVSHFDFFNWLDKSPADIDTVCKSLGIKKRPTDVMLTLFKAYGLINENNEKYYLSDVSRDYLTSKSSFDLTSYVSSLKNRPICRDLKTVLQTGRPVNWAAAKEGKDWATSMQDIDFAESFTAAMNSRGAYLAHGLLKVIDLHTYRNILDIGGASGIYSAILLDKYPGVHSTIFEKPPVDKVARYSVNKLGLASRIDVLAGDMFHDSFPEGYDVQLLSHVLHDWDLNEVKIILANSFRTLNPEGRIFIHDAHINKSKTGPVSVAEYSVLLMALSEGKCYSITEMKSLLEEAGFQNIEYKPTVLNRSIITAKK
jgi:2-polyprenyl-3-methyl-5-hydroxy-6-metoxy-1,4-benzoquinol methylase